MSLDKLLGFLLIFLLGITRSIRRGRRCWNTWGPGMYSTEDIMHRQTLLNKRNMLRRGLNATESCAEHSGTFNRRREGIEVEGKIPNLRTHENVRRIFFKYIFVFLVHQPTERIWVVLCYSFLRRNTVYQRKVKWSGHGALATFCHWWGPRNSTSWTSHDKSRGRILLQTLCCTDQIKKYALTQGDT